MVHVKGKQMVQGLKRWMKNVEKNAGKPNGDMSDAESFTYELSRWMEDHEKAISEIKKKLQIP